MARTRTLEQQLPTLDAAQDLRTLSEGLADEHPEVREQCAQKLAALKNPDAGPFLRHALDDDSEQVRLWGAYGLGILARKEDQHELARAAQQDESPLVRVWATFGLAHLGEAPAVAKLLSFLDLPDLEVKSNAADALLTLEDLSGARPQLEKRLAAEDLRKRAWAAAILHRLGHKGAFGVWREALVDPDSRVDAAMAATHLRAPAAARELVRVAVELTRDELEAPVAAASDLPLAEVLTSPLLELELDALAEQARKDDPLRHDLLLILLRGPTSDPEVLGQLYQFAATLEAERIAADAAEILGEQDKDDRPFLLSRLLDFAPEAVELTLSRMDPADRTEVLEAVGAAAGAPDDSTLALAPLYRALRDSRYGQAFAALPDHPWGEEPSTDLGVETVGDTGLDEEAMAELDAMAEEEDLALVVEQMVAGEEVPEVQRKAAETMLADLGMSAEEFVASLHEGGFEDEALAPEPEQVALRALALGALQERARIEEESADQKLSPEDARAAAKALVAWLEGEGILEIVTPLELDLLEADPGDWLDEDMELVDASTEALAVLLWTLEVAELPPPDREVEPATVMKKLPLLSATEKFVARATLREAEDLERVRDLYETLLWRAEQEGRARLALAGEEVDSELDLDAIVEDLARDGFDAEKIRQKGGEGAVLAEALRFLGKKAAAKLEEEGQLTAIKGDFGFEDKPLTALSEEDLSMVLALAHERNRAVNWILNGGDWDELPFEEEEEEQG